MQYLVTDEYCDPVLCVVEETLPLLELYRQDLVTYRYYESYAESMIDRHNIHITGGFAD